MARGRMISNAIAQDKRINQLMDDTSRLAYTWLITFADCEGRTPGDPAVVRSMLFPRREDITIAQMDGYIRQWHDLGLVIWYEAKDDKWIYFPAFFNHNKVNKEHESPSKIPEPPQDKDDTKINLSQDKIPLNLNQVKVNSIEEEVKPKPTISIASSINSFNSSTDYRKCEQLYQKITKQPSIPSTATTAFHDLQTIIDYYKGNIDQAVQEGMPIFTNWCNTVGKNGHPYSRTNTAWIGKWLEKLAPQPVEIIVDNSVKMTDEEYAEYNKKMNEARI